MSDSTLLARVTSRADVFGGKPIIRDLRISVETILSLLSQGMSWDALLTDYPELVVDDIRACLEYARAAIADDRIDAVKVSSR